MGSVSAGRLAGAGLRRGHQVAASTAGIACCWMGVGVS
jgi:hypothetical protein